MINFDINKVTFEERVIMSYDGYELSKDSSDKEQERSTTTLYFTAPKEWTECTEGDHCGSCIDVSFPTHHPIAAYASVKISPTIENEDSYTDVDWHTLDISDEEIQSLIDKAFEVIQKS